MKRREQLEDFAKSYANFYVDDNYTAIINGVEWADEHPKEGLVSIDKAVEWLESVNLDYYQIREGVFSRELVTDFRRAMEE